MDNLDLMKYDNVELLEKIIEIQEFIEKRNNNETTIIWNTIKEPGDYFYQLVFKAITESNQYSLGFIERGIWITKKEIKDALKNPKKYFEEKKLIHSNSDYKKYFMYSSTKNLYQFIIEDKIDDDEDEEEVSEDEIRWITEKDVINFLNKISVKYK